MNLSTIFCILGLVVLTTSQPLGGGWSPVDPAANSTVAIAQVCWLVLKFRLSVFLSHG